MNHRYLKVEPYDMGFWRDPKSLIRLKGRWLREAGFEPGYTVTVRVAPGEITLFVADHDEKLQPASATVPPAQDKVKARQDRRYE